MQNKKDIKNYKIQLGKPGKYSLHVIVKVYYFFCPKGWRYSAYVVPDHDSKRRPNAIPNNRSVLVLVKIDQIPGKDIMSVGYV